MIFIMSMLELSLLQEVQALTDQVRGELEESGGVVVLDQAGEPDGSAWAYCAGATPGSR